MVLTMPDQKFILRPAPRVVHRLIAGRALILDPETDQLRHLNESGALLWSLIAEGRYTREALFEALLERFEVSEAEAREDLECFLALLSERGLIEFLELQP